MFTTFQRILTPGAIAEDPAAVKCRGDDDAEAGTGKAARKRRAHRKSRGGCGECRRRRVKCDERRPECGQCAYYGRKGCAYGDDSPGDEVSALLNEIPSKEIYSGIKDTRELIAHFFETTHPLWIGTADCQSILQENIPRLAPGSPFLSHAVLAFSAYHIAVVYSDRKREMAGAWHYSLALQTYREAIDDARVSADALFACCMLLTMLAFKNLSNEPYDDGLSATMKDPALDTVGIRFIGGPRLLSEAFARTSMLDQILWRPLIRHCEDQPAANNDALAGIPLAARSMAGLEALCRSEEPTDCPFATALDSLRLLMQCYVSDRPAMVEHTFGFAIKLDARFLRFVEEGSPRALLVLCYWYAFVAQVEQWWACDTARFEGVRLLRRLREDAVDGDVRALLEFPGELLMGTQALGM
ncbi:hypothetical protein BU24DRAFT_94525 [Aaosphaeria arxii CBS 175.79]|uniref:Zn(2)-C6 fungal-type domain-containing protein n=1 Tax=Aaosphaeria arxii CBS 175.79 TaxID=1450172 RepID=A0A6A5X6X4_9PLEO|nr:uncharacterized protein BU24DRAFT_94525 [Aaosphaeria arxii CBS 175.79]KAF2008651.1 hypothetical protein BU24DRAFT_94525 [Aaosphaeria arxii CBS 175.79]